MKKLFIIATLLAGQIGAMAQIVDTLTVRINGMRCEECAHKVGKAVRQEQGIEAIEYNLERRTAKIAFDTALTSAEAINTRLDATGRYKATTYDPTAVIRRGMGLRMDDMHCQNCANRIAQKLSQIEGVDSMAAHIDKHYYFIRYDANRTSKADIKKALTQIGYTPVNYYTGPKVDYAYFLLNEEQATQATADEVITIDGVEDVNVSQRRKSMAVTFFTDETDAGKLAENIRAAGIDITIPAPHVCKEEKSN